MVKKDNISLAIKSTIEDDDLAYALEESNFTLSIGDKKFDFSVAPFILGKVVTTKKGPQIELFSREDRVKAVLQSMIEEDGKALAEVYAASMERNDDSFFDLLFPKLMQLDICREALNQEIVTEEMVYSWFYSVYHKDGMKPIPSSEKTMKAPKEPSMPESKWGDLSNPVNFQARLLEVVAEISATTETEGADIMTDFLQSKEDWTKYANDIASYQAKLSEWNEYLIAKEAGTLPKEEAKPRSAITETKVLHFITQYVMYKALAEFLHPKYEELINTGAFLMHRKSSNEETQERKLVAQAKQAKKYKHLVEN
ncbi:MAG: hypothetical protein BV459_01500 [Thermoplasmata archaeon M11B2D]|nr:MAG: hypothetical protein BV459_01500 [Thermoplasmata archaeon M11B2D]